jgi:hypothetical protein
MSTRQNENLWENLHDALKYIQTRPLFVMRLDVRPILDVGNAPAGHRRVGVVFGGVFEGDRLSGQVIDGGADWQTVRPDNAVALDVRLILKTDDGAPIAMVYQGIRHGSPEVVARIERGEILDPATHYFRTAPRFETAASEYAWLNRIIAVGTGHRSSVGVVYSVFEVL